MTIRLVKQNQQRSATEKPPSAPTVDQLRLTTQGWVEEFKTRKARRPLSLDGLMKRS